MLDCFNCVDVRDNLYGILSLVRWADGRGPTPDYTKDNFEVAKYVLSLWARDDIFLSKTYQCSLLLNLFDVTLELASLRDAIVLRSSVAPPTDLGLQGNHDSEMAEVEKNWRGIQIIGSYRISEHADGRRQSNLHSCYMEQVQNGRFVLIRIGSRITVRALVDTRVGDWCLVEDPFPHRRMSCRRGGLILRELDDHKYVAVGSALIDYTDATLNYSLEKEESCFSRFKGWSDPEDLMVLEWMKEELARKKQVSDKDIEKFVNMRVCGWKDSSRFEKACGRHLNKERCQRSSS